ncbi:hypothetical protein KJ940_22140, partial [Myxococcota bacterium]|nr:hypothetical protein [Myxococcota bacterium]
SAPTRAPAVEVAPASAPALEAEPASAPAPKPVIKAAPKPRALSYPSNVALGYPKDPKTQPADVVPPWIDKPARYHLGFGFGMRFYDERFDALLKEGFQGNAELTAGIRLFDHLWLDITRRYAQQEEEVHAWIDTRFSDDSWRAQLAYRRHLTGMLLIHAQLGPSYHWLEAEIAGDELHAKAETWGASASAGLIFLPIASGHMPKLRRLSGDMGLGFGLRLTYDYVPAVEMEAAGGRMGQLNASGLGWMFSNVLQF